MAKKVLVAYGTKYGATAGIAEKIGETLRQAGLEVDVAAADKAAAPGGYDAVVLGSGVYIGAWRKDAAAYLTRYEQALAQRPVWLFSSGPIQEGDPLKAMNGWIFPKALQAVADRIEPRSTVIFAGMLDPKKLNWIERWMMKTMKAPMGDFRDWAAIAAWAQGIADALQ